MIELNPKLIYFLIGLTRDIYLSLFVFLLTFYKLDYITNHLGFAITSFLIALCFILFNKYKEQYRNKYFTEGLK